MATDCERLGHEGDIGKKESEAGILPSHGISLDVPGIDDSGRPSIIQHLSLPAYQSPVRHHRRHASQHHEVKETLNARSEYTNNHKDGKSQHHINQYIIGEEIGRGSFGAVHLAVDQYGTEFAVKEFSKSRLRKRAQSNILRRPHGPRRPGQLAAGQGFNSPLHRHSASDIHNDDEKGNPLYLIKEEIAIMKKLNHPNLVSLIEVLDDPEEDSLYMVLEMCKKGVVMKVGLDEEADPYDVESCRCWFRDLILGIEYLHAQGVLHRDIKPDNLLLTDEDVLKIVDFGVSEMFEKQSEMMTAKSAGSPAFLPPELCVVKHGDIAGKAADIWSMGVSLYCLRFGRIPFERSGVLELYEAIKHDEIDYTPENEPNFVDLMNRILEKDAKKRITMDELRDHPWVTNNGTDPLLPKEENTANLVEPPTESEIYDAITSNMKNLLVVMRAVKKFKSLLYKKRPALLSGALDRGVRIVDSSYNLDGSDGQALQRSQSDDTHNRRAVEGALVTEGVHRKFTSSAPEDLPPVLSRIDSAVTIKSSKPSTQDHLLEHHHGHADSAVVKDAQDSRQRQESTGEKGHAHDPMDEEPLWLGIGTGGGDSADDENLAPPAVEVIAESPTAAEFNIYDTAYRMEVERIRKAQGGDATVYLTRRVDDKKEYRADENMVDAPTAEQVQGMPHAGWKDVLDAAREKEKQANTKLEATEPLSLSKKLRGLVAQAEYDARVAPEGAFEKEEGLSGKGGMAVANALHKAMEKRIGQGASDGT